MASENQIQQYVEKWTCTSRKTLAYRECIGTLIQDIFTILDEVKDPLIVKEILQVFMLIVKL